MGKDSKPKKEKHKKKGSKEKKAKKEKHRKQRRRSSSPSSDSSSGSDGERLGVNKQLAMGRAAARATREILAYNHDLRKELREVRRRCPLAALAAACSRRRLSTALASLSGLSNSSPDLPSSPLPASLLQLVRQLDSGGALDVSGIPDAFLRGRLLTLFDNLVQLSKNSAVGRLLLCIAAARHTHCACLSLPRRAWLAGLGSTLLSPPSIVRPCLPASACLPACACAGPVLPAQERGQHSAVLCGPPAGGVSRGAGTLPPSRAAARGGSGSSNHSSYSSRGSRC